MAVHARSGGVWTLLLGACVSLVAGTDCGKECALCVYRLLEQQSGFSPLTCSLECDGGLDSQKLRLCREALLEEESRVPLEEDARPEAEAPPPAGAGAATAEDDEEIKKYSGLLKRYGGFMAHRSPPEGLLEDAGAPDQEEKVRLAILKILNEADGGEAVKRYGGFMRRAEGGAAQGELLEAVLGRGLKKRYGGFMRRVGRPEWLVDSGKAGGGGLKRALENGGELQKRYGGFMD